MQTVRIKFSGDFSAGVDVSIPAANLQPGLQHWGKVNGKFCYCVLDE